MYCIASWCILRHTRDMWQDVMPIRTACRVFLSYTPGREYLSQAATECSIFVHGHCRSIAVGIKGGGTDAGLRSEGKRGEEPILRSDSEDMPCIAVPHSSVRTPLGRILVFT